MIVINDNQENIIIDKKLEEKIQEVYDFILKEENVPGFLETSLTIIDNDEIHSINNEYRNIDRPTDVLSFPMYEKEEIKDLANLEDSEILLGDIFISAERAKEQSEEFNHSFLREFVYLFIHGMLHLLGYDHIDEEDKKEMRAREKDILTKFQITREI